MSSTLGHPGPTVSCGEFWQQPMPQADLTEQQLLAEKHLFGHGMEPGV